MAETYKTDHVKEMSIGKCTNYLFPLHNPQILNKKGATQMSNSFKKWLTINNPLVKTILLLQSLRLLHP